MKPAFAFLHACRFAAVQEREQLLLEPPQLRACLAEPPIGVSQFADLGELLRGRGDVLWPALAAIGEDGAGVAYYTNPPTDVKPRRKKIRRRRKTQNRDFASRRAVPVARHGARMPAEAFGAAERALSHPGPNGRVWRRPTRPPPRCRLRLNRSCGKIRPGSRSCSSERNHPPGKPEAFDKCHSECRQLEKPFAAGR